MFSVLENDTAIIRSIYSVFLNVILLFSLLLQRLDSDTSMSIFFFSLTKGICTLIRIRLKCGYSFSLYTGCLLDSNEISYREQTSTKGTGCIAI